MHACTQVKKARCTAKKLGARHVFKPTILYRKNKVLLLYVCEFEPFRGYSGTIVDNIHLKMCGHLTLGPYQQCQNRGLGGLVESAIYGDLDLKPNSSQSAYSVSQWAPQRLAPALSGTFGG